jgi:hypothetical protein
MKPAATNIQILHYLRLNGPTRSSDLVAQLGLSRATLSRRLQELGGAVVVIGRGRATRLAARHPGEDQPFPLYRISETGRAAVIGELIPIETGEWFLQSDNCPPALCQGEFKEGIFPGWPWFLEDLRPAGFLGRAFAKRLARLLGYDEDPGKWSDLQVANALSRFGPNLAGNFILGEKALDEFQREKIRIAHGFHANNTPAIYPQTAELALNEGEDFGSSAAGEQPKFTTLICDGPESSPREVIVKFSPPTDTSAGRRWADLLWAEHFANETLAEHGFAVAQTRVFEPGARVFLESTRFDRVSVSGRRGVVSLRALDAAYIGQASDNWAASARLLHAAGMINAQDRDTIVRLHCFGELIGNTDMHFGNVSFFLPDERPLLLCPVYDMLPMRFRPTGTGEVRAASLTPSLPRPENEAAWQAMWPAAHDYWKSLARSTEVSGDFQQIARDAVDVLGRIRSILGG